MIKKLFPLVFLISCGVTTPDANEIVDQAIEVSGTSVLDNAVASFDFRGMTYKYKESNGQFIYQRIQQDSVSNTIIDVLSNAGLERFVNDTIADITEEKRAAYTSSVNSVIYFAFLPMQLNDAAVIKEYVGQSTVKEKSYYKIKVTFQQEGGGEDYEDVFYYWFDTEDYSMDYLAYSYNEDDDIGIRFRVAYDARKVNGVTIQDYENWKPTAKGNVPLESIEEAYQKGELTLLSKVELEHVQIDL